MEWISNGIVLGAKAFGENQAILHIFTPDLGRWVGLLPHAHTKKNHILSYPGNQVQAKWRGRLPEHLGTWQLEIQNSPVTKFMTEPLKLFALESAASLTIATLAERHPYGQLYTQWVQFIQEQAVPAAYAQFEIFLLKELGFGLNFNRCAVSGSTENIHFVSPKTGNAVTYNIGKEYQDQLFIIPEFLKSSINPPSFQDIFHAFQLSGYFLKKHLMDHIHENIFDVRQRYINYFIKSFPNV